MDTYRQLLNYAERHRARWKLAVLRGDRVAQPIHQACWFWARQRLVSMFF